MFFSVLECSIDGQGAHCINTRNFLAFDCFLIASDIMIVKTSENIVYKFL